MKIVEVIRPPRPATGSLARQAPIVAGLALAIVAASLFTSARTASANGDATITVNMQTGEVTPKNPIVNLMTTSSVTIEITPQPTIEFYAEADVNAAEQIYADLLKARADRDAARIDQRAAPNDPVKLSNLKEKEAAVVAKEAARNVANEKIGKRKDDETPERDPKKRVRPAYWYSTVGASQIYPNGKNETFSASSSVSLRFIRTKKPGSRGCDAANEKTSRAGEEVMAAGAERRQSAVTALKTALAGSCVPQTVAFLELGQSSWTIFGALERLDFIIEPLEGSSLQQSYPRRTVSIQLVEKAWVLDWSGGFAFLGARDERYRLDPIAGDTQSSALTRVSDAGVSYKISAFGNYSPVQQKWLALTVGLGTDVPVKGLAVFAGASFALRPAIVSDSALLTFGASYASRKQLAPDFEGRTIVPAGTSTDSLVADKYDVGVFLGLSFGFFGSSDKFKAVYPGNAASSSSDSSAKR